jgi:NADH-quinone oxidoreductase subunit N
MAKVQLWPMLALLVFFVSLVGLPPTLGFLGKAGLFLVLAEGFQALKSTFYLWMGVLALLNAAVALFYYLHIPYQAWLKPAAEELPVIPYSAKIWWPAQVLVVVFVVILIGGFFWNNWFSW